MKKSKYEQIKDKAVDVQVVYLNFLFMNILDSGSKYGFYIEKFLIEFYEYSGIKYGFHCNKVIENLEI